MSDNYEEIVIQLLENLVQELKRDPALMKRLLFGKVESGTQIDKKDEPTTFLESFDPFMVLRTKGKEALKTLLRDMDIIILKKL